MLQPSFALRLHAVWLEVARSIVPEGVLPLLPGRWPVTG